MGLGERLAAAAVAVKVMMVLVVQVMVGAVVDSGRENILEAADVVAD